MALGTAVDMLVSAFSAAGLLSVQLVDNLEIIFRPYYVCPGSLLLVELCLGYSDLLVILFRSLMSRQVSCFWNLTITKPMTYYFSRFAGTPLLNTQETVFEDSGNKCRQDVPRPYPGDVGFNSKAVFGLESCYSCPSSSTNSKSRLFPKAGAFFSSQETCLLVTWMISSRKQLKGPPTLFPPADPLTIWQLLVTDCQHLHQAPDLGASLALLAYLSSTT